MNANFDKLITEKFEIRPSFRLIPVSGG